MSKSFDWRRYEQLKQDWISQNPRATSDQYQDAVRQIEAQVVKESRAAK